MTGTTFALITYRSTLTFFPSEHLWPVYRRVYFTVFFI
jgi:hypothetical protein